MDKVPTLVKVIMLKGEKGEKGDSGGTWGAISGTISNQTDLVNLINTNVQNEATARQNADTSLSTQISSEATARQNADTSLSNQISALQGAVGSPLKASTVSAMTDTTKIYVYTGSESGYTSGNWYYYNGSAWVSGGVYNSVAIETDTTLSVSGMPADAKMTGDAVGDLKEYKTSIATKLDTLSIKKTFPIDVGETIKIYTVDGSNFTATNLSYYNKSFSKLGFHALSAFATSKRVVTLSFTEAVSFVAIEGGTAQDIIVERISLSAVSDLINHEKISSHVNAVLDTLDEYVPFHVSQGHTVLVKSEDDTIFTPTTIILYNANKVQTESFSLASWGVNARTLTTAKEAFYARLVGGTAQSVLVYDYNANYAEYINEQFNELNAEFIYSTTVSELNTIAEFFAELNDSITFRSVDGSLMTPTYIYLYDSALTQLAYFGLNGWGTSRTIDNDRGQIRYVRLVAGTAQDIEVINNTRRKSDFVSDCISLTLDYPANVSDVDTSRVISTFESHVSANESNESFIFFTDPHTLREIPSAEKETYYLLSLLKKYYNDSSAEFLISGGDWLQDGDNSNTARKKLAYMIGHCNSMISPCYQIVGNHDTNYQGTETINNGQLANIIFRKQKKNYYSFDGHSSKFYVLDSGVDGKTEMTAYDLEQIAWLCTELLANTNDHIVVCIHIFWSDTSYTLDVWGSALTDIVNAFNNKGTYSNNGASYDFSNANGKIEFVLAGHTHADMSQVLTSGVPVIATRNAGYGNYAFDMINVDYDAKTLTCTRVGAGNDRNFVLS